MHLCCESFTEMFIGAATFTMGAYSTQELIEFCSSKNDEGLPILRAFCGSAIITNVLRSHGKILRRTLGDEDQPLHEPSPKAGVSRREAEGGDHKARRAHIHNWYAQISVHLPR